MLGSPFQVPSTSCPEDADGHSEDEVSAASDDNDRFESDGDLPPVPNTGKVHRIPLVTNLHIDSVGVERVINAFGEALRDTEEQKTKKQPTSAENH